MRVVDVMVERKVVEVIVEVMVKEEVVVVKREAVRAAMRAAVARPTFCVLVSTLSMERIRSCAHASSLSGGQKPAPALLCARFNATFGRVCLS